MEPACRAGLHSMTVLGSGSYLGQLHEVPDHAVLFYLGVPPCLGLRTLWYQVCHPALKTVWHL